MQLNRDMKYMLPTCRTEFRLTDVGVIVFRRLLHSSVVLANIKLQYVIYMHVDCSCVATRDDALGTCVCVWGYWSCAMCGWYFVLCTRLRHNSLGKCRRRTACLLTKRCSQCCSFLLLLTEICSHIRDTRSVSTILRKCNSHEHETRAHTHTCGDKTAKLAIQLCIQL